MAGARRSRRQRLDPGMKREVSKVLLSGVRSKVSSYLATCKPVMCPFLPSTVGFLSMCITFTSNPEPLIVCCASVCTRYRLSAVLVARNRVIGKDFAIFFLAVD